MRRARHQRWSATRRYVHVPTRSARAPGCQPPPGAGEPDGRSGLGRISRDAPGHPVSRTGRREGHRRRDVVQGVQGGWACGAGQRPTRRGSCTWERRTLPVPAPVFRVIPRFSDIHQDESTCSHVHRPPCTHMGAHQSISTIRAEPRNLNEKRRPPHRAPFLPCANHPCSTGRAPREPISSRNRTDLDPEYDRSRRSGNRRLSSANRFEHRPARPHRRRRYLVASTS